MDNNEKKNIIVMCSTESKPTVKDYIAAGFGFYIGWNIARTLKYLVLLRGVKKD